MAPKLKTAILAGTATLVAIASGIAYAAGGGNSDYKMEHKHWHFNGAFGTYDRAAMQRGYQVYREVCAACHQLEHLSFRHLGDKGGPFYDAKYPNPNDNPYVKNFAADWQIEDIDGETGDVIERPGIPADEFPDIFANEAAARASNGGADYLYNLLVAYEAEMPDDVELGTGLHYNPAFEGGQIAMAPPLSDELVEYSDGTVATTAQMAADVTEFLAWSADPKMEQRKSAGLMTMIYLAILSVLLWLSYRRVWRNVEH